MELIISKKKYQSLLQDLKDQKKVIKKIKQKENMIFVANKSVEGDSNNIYQVIVLPKGQSSTKKTLNLTFDKDKVIIDKKELEEIVSFLKAEKWWQMMFHL